MTGYTPDDDDGDSWESATPPPPPDDWAAQLLTFWFDAHGDADWFGGGPAFDEKVTRFADWHDALRSLPVDAFLPDTQTALAAVILFDQVPRNIYRGSAEAFATDTLALAVARGAIDRGFDAGLSQQRRLFLYLPSEHSEDMDDQRESLRLMASLDDARYLEFAQAHFDIIRQFGRFPHRNAVLGRADRDGEADAIKTGSHW